MKETPFPPHLRPLHPGFRRLAFGLSFVGAVGFNLLLWQILDALHRHPPPPPRPLSPPPFAIVTPPKPPPPPPPSSPQAVSAAQAPASSILPSLLLPSPIPLPSIPPTATVGPIQLLHPSEAVGEGARGAGKTDKPATSALVLTEEMADEAPQILTKPPAAYPAHAEAAQIEGEVELRILVDPQGKVEDSEVVSSRPTGIFDASAQEAVRRWTFRPGVFQGRPTYVWLRQRLTFRLR